MAWRVLLENGTRVLLLLLLKAGWRQTPVDRCFFTLFDPETGDLISVAAYCCKEDHWMYQHAKSQLQQQFKVGSGIVKISTLLVVGLGVFVDQESYAQQWFQEILICQQRASQPKAPLNASEISSLRAALGRFAWIASQTGPHHQAEVYLLLSEVPFATV